MKRGRLIPLLGGVGAGLIAVAALLLMGGKTHSPVETYRLADYGGRVAVYGPGESALPGRITSIHVQLLPAADRAQLREGIPARDGRELAMLLEALGS